VQIYHFGAIYAEILTTVAHRAHQLDLVRIP
jgi:hypothetical protein